MIHWFPGHMHKATKLLQCIFPQIDIAIEVVDARAPDATINPALHQIAKATPIIKVLSRKDLADPALTKRWLECYKGRAIAVDICHAKIDAEKITGLCKKICQKKYPQKGSILKPIRVVVFGLPNLGKSTLINALAKRKIAKTGNEPAITKVQQKIEIAKNFYLYDTPGIMFPSPKDEACGYKLAIIGAIRDTAMDYLSAAEFLIDYLQQYYPLYLKKRFKLDDINLSSDILLNNIGQIMRQSNMHHVAERIIHDFRQGRIGRISLEIPADKSII